MSNDGAHQMDLDRSYSVPDGSTTPQLVDYKPWPFEIVSEREPAEWDYPEPGLPPHELKSVPEADGVTSAEPVAAPAPPDPRSPKRIALSKKLLTVELVAALYTVADGTLYPVLQQYIYSALSDDYNITEQRDDKCADSNTTQKNYTEEEQATLDAFHDEVGMYNSLLMVFGLLPLLFIMNFIGPYSDQTGRKRVLIPALFTCLLSGTLAVFVIAFNLPIYILFFGYMVSGLTGGSATIMISTFAYIADIHLGAQRLYRILLIELLSGFGTLITSIALGYLIKYTGFVVPAAITQCITLCLLIYCVFFVEETVERRPDAKFFSKEILTKVPKVLFYDDGTGGRGKILFTTFAWFLFAFASNGMMTVVTIYLLDPPFCWDSDFIGIFNGFTFIIKAIGGLVLVKILGKYIPPPLMMLIACISSALYYLFLAPQANNWLPFIGAVLGFGAMVGGPAFRDYGSKLVRRDQQGALFAGFTWFHMLSMVVGSVAFNMIYAETIHTMHGLVMIIDTLLYIPPLIFIIILWYIFREDRKRALSEVQNVEGAAVTPESAIVQKKD